MHTHYLTLLRQIKSIRSSIEDSTICESFSHNKNEWVLGLEQQDGRKTYLQLSADGMFPYIILLEGVRRRPNSADVLSVLPGKKISRIHLLPGDRVVRCELDDAGLTLYLQFFTNRVNFMLTGTGGEVIAAFKDERAILGKIIEFADTQQDEAFSFSREDFRRVLERDPDATLKKALRGITLINKTLREEVLARTHLDGKARYAELGSSAIDRLLDELGMLLDECRTGDPRIYFVEEMPARFSLCPLLHLAELDFKVYEDCNEAVRRFSFQAKKYQLLEGRRTRYLGLITKKIASLEHAKTQMEQVTYDPEKKANFQHLGQLVLAYSGPLAPDTRVIRAVDYYDPLMPEISIPVDGSLSAKENAERYFARARQYDDNRTELDGRKRAINRQLANLTQIAGELADVSIIREMKRIEERLKSMHLLQAGEKEQAAYRLPYKRYTVAATEIWVGKNARDNDELTFKHAHKEDIWLHVQGYAGSHVVIRNTSRDAWPERGVIEYAARLAVTNSAAKHASYVPVNYTRVKHVRKPRKSPPGTVLPSMVKTVFVDPL